MPLRAQEKDLNDQYFPRRYPDRDQHVWHHGFHRIFGTRNDERATCVLITNNEEEAVLLADCVAMMTNGPQDTIGKITYVNLSRPRSRKAALQHPDYAAHRQEILDFLEEYAHGATPQPKPKAIAAE